MSPGLAWLRAIALTTLLTASVSYARDEILFTSSVTYCDPPETLLVQQFDMVYFNKNESVFFNISASSVEENVNVTANLLLNVYGLTPVNVTIDLCDILGGALCPLPQYNFVGSDTLSLPSSLNVADKIPGIAFKVPDLEGYAQLSLLEVGTGDLKACVQATLSNGWSTHQPAVTWSTAGVAIAALISAVWQSLSPTALAPCRFLDLLYLYQTIASSALLDLNYPSVYRAFALNFAWAIGLVPSSSEQNTIDHMRYITGGRMANSTSGSAIAFVNRKLSPYNDQSLISTNTASSGFSPLNLGRRSSSGIFEQIKILSTEGVATVTSSSSNVLDAGVPIYTNSIHIATANAFMTVFFAALILTAIALAVFGLGYVGLLAMHRFRLGRAERRVELKALYSSLVRVWSLRLGLLFLYPIVVFAFYQWTLKDSWLSILLSVIAFLAVACGTGYSAFIVMRTAHQSKAYALYSRPAIISSHGPLYAQYRTARYFFFLISLACVYLKAIFIVFAKASGLAQIILFLTVEVGVMTSVFVLRPHRTRGADVLASYLAIVRLVCTGLMIAFVERLAVDAIPRVAIGIVMAVIYSVAVIVVVINFVLHCGIQQLWTKQDTSQHEGSANDAMVEKDDRGSSFPDLLRPKNATPEQNIPLDPEINEPHTPLTPPSAEGEQNVNKRDSASTNFGNLLPRRWSFTPLSSPADSHLSHPSLSSPYHTQDATRHQHT
ncbi:TRP-domain-containing protein [Guyanagaster necrorhizus]|uniref:TRP-domain-containing protein n=1 Tax=Guyanagaster necrorhizus TaxID=856835 RepID=A0A9P7VV20_9AGAR|nr:TRP-domain-containing protein [Guyanagaster necrorhizus MCA 3950]KAG7446396.1 TRP-domain-containing protein [Guyanagaster necrorhizus MCA 3950]